MDWVPTEHENLLFALMFTIFLGVLGVMFIMTALNQVRRENEEELQ